MNTRVKVLHNDELWDRLDDRINEALEELDGTLISVTIRSEYRHNEEAGHFPWYMVVIVYEPTDPLSIAYNIPF